MKEGDKSDGNIKIWRGKINTVNYNYTHYEYRNISTGNIKLYPLWNSHSQGFSQC